MLFICLRLTGNLLHYTSARPRFFPYKSSPTFTVYTSSYTLSLYNLRPHIPKMNHNNKYNYIPMSCIYNFKRQKIT
jgi:hypothetical protein